MLRAHPWRNTGPANSAENGNSVAPSNPAALTAGGIFNGRYQILRCIKAGGMGAVYEVIHLETKRRRALKVMLPHITTDPELRARFKLEATAVAEVESEHIVETFDAGVDEATGSPFLVMELLRGQDLGVLLTERTRLCPEEVVTFLFQAALALDKTHAAGIVHRDIKPENLFLTHRDDGTPRVKILDFGIARIVSQASALQSTRSIGTPLYMSPEQVRGEGTLGPASDLHALAHIAYTLLVGEAYWKEQQLGPNPIYAVLYGVTQGIVEPASQRALRRANVTLPPAFDSWFSQGTAIVPANRFPDGKALVAALSMALGVGATKIPLAPSVSPLSVSVKPGAVATPPTPAQAYSAEVLSSADLPTARAPASAPWDRPPARTVGGKALVGAALVGGAVLVTGVGVFARSRSIPPIPATALSLRDVPTSAPALSPSTGLTPTSAVDAPVVEVVSAAPSASIAAKPVDSAPAVMSAKPVFRGPRLAPSAAKSTDTEDPSTRM